GTGARAHAVGAALRDRGSGAAESPLAPGYPSRAVRVVEQARRVAAIVELATEDHGAAVNTYEMSARAGFLAPLERACRRALVAAFNSALEPSATA
ncbi:MAG: hypothetical protein HOV68_33525, partial [Streptomycetaceae bacterium]|nr:hypothetical protein [Streptomycetaceae bacterium]